MTAVKLSTRRAMAVFALRTDLNAHFVGTGLIARRQGVTGLSFPSFPSTLSAMGTKKSHDGKGLYPLVPVVPTDLRGGTCVSAGARARRRLYSLCISQNRGNDGNESVPPHAVLRISRSHESKQRWERAGTSGVEWERDRPSPKVSLSARSKEPERRHETNDARTAHELVRCIKGEDPCLHLLLWWPTPSSCCSTATESGPQTGRSPPAPSLSMTQATTYTTTDAPAHDEIDAADGGEAA